MGYWFDGVFKDKQIWTWIGFKVLIIVGVFGLILESFAGEFLNGFLYKIPFGLIATLLIISAVKGSKEQKEEKRLETDQKHFEGKKRNEFKAVLRENPGFQTFCFECEHYDNGRTVCRIQSGVLDKRALKTRFDGYKYEYCLYWKEKKMIVDRGQ